MFKPPYHGNGLLTPAVIHMLQAMSACGAEEDDYLCDSEEAVKEGSLVWVHTTTFHCSTLYKALQLCALRDVSDEGGGVERYVLNEVGRAILDDPSQADAVVLFLYRGISMTVSDGKVVELK